MLVVTLGDRSGWAEPRDERRMKLPTAGCCQFGPRMVPVHISGGEGRVAAIPVSVKTILKPSLQYLLNGCFLSNQGFLGHFGTQSMPSLFRDEMGWTPTVAAICSCCRKVRLLGRKPSSAGRRGPPWGLWSPRYGDGRGS